MENDTVNSNNYNQLITPRIILKKSSFSEFPSVILQIRQIVACGKVGSISLNLSRKSMNVEVNIAKMNPLKWQVRNTLTTNGLNMQ